MTIVLVILAVLILLAVLFLINRVNKISDSILSTTTNCYSKLVDYFLTLEKNVTTQANTIITTINDERTDVVRLTNKVEEINTYCRSSLNSFNHTVATLSERLVAPIDKINDTHNRIKTLGKGATSTDELRTVVTEVVSAIATEAVDSVCQKCAPKPKTTKKVAKEPVIEVKA